MSTIITTIGDWAYCLDEANGARSCWAGSIELTIEHDGGLVVNVGAGDTLKRIPPEMIAWLTGFVSNADQLARARTVALSHHAAGLIDDLALHRHLADLADRERAARVAVSAAEASRGTGYPEDPRSVAEALAALRAACEAADEHRRREIVRRLAGKVTVGHHGVEVTLRLPAEWIRSSDRLRAGSNSERLAGRVAVYLPGGRDVPVHRKRRVG